MYEYHISEGMRIFKIFVQFTIREGIKVYLFQTNILHLLNSNHRIEITGDSQRIVPNRAESHISPAHEQLSSLFWEWNKTGIYWN